MNRKHTLGLAVAIVAIASSFALGVAVGQQAPPTEARGMSVSKTSVIDLGPEIDSVDGRQLRLRVVSFDPGGVAPIHSHKGRPAVAYVMQGTLTEFREGGWVKEHKHGDVLVENKDVTHWAVNKGDVPTVLIAVDVFKP